MKTARPLVPFLWLLTCALSCIDTHLMVYPSLSQSLLGGGCMLVLGIYSVVHCLLCKHHFLQHGFQWLILLWAAYMVLHVRFIAEAEHYRLTYLILNLTLLFTLPYLLKTGLLTVRRLVDGILLMILIQLVFLLLQGSRLVESGNEAFLLTGSNDNPNVTAMLLALGIPFLYDRMKQPSHKRSLYAVMLILAVLFLILLRCRTAYLGLATIVAVHTLRGIRFSHWSPRKWCLTGVLSCCVIACSAAAMYQMKPDSADGRLLIWKLSSGLLIGHPEGVGIGMFEHDYNLCQGEYFASGHPSECESRNAGTVYMAYNDFLEHGVEAGIIGLILLTGFYLSAIHMAFRQRNIRAVALLAAVILMSSVNFFYASVQAWLLLMAVCSTLCLSPEERVCETRTEFCKKTLPVFAILLCCFCQTRLPSLIYAQMRFSQYRDAVQRGHPVSREALASLAAGIGTSEAYHRFMSDQYRAHGEYDLALESILLAMSVTSTPEVYFSVFDCYDSMKRTSEGIPYVCQLSRMLPQNLTSRLILLQWYDHNHDRKAAEDMAKEIADIPIKIRNERSEEIQRYARSYLNNY